MKIKSLLFSAALALSLAPLVQGAELEKIAYPTAENPSFIISVPADWKMTQAEEKGDFFHLDGPTGALFSFRTIKGSKESLEKAIEESIEDAGEKLKDVKLDEPQDWKPSGLEGMYVTGTGKDKEDGTPVRIGMAWCALNDGNIVELWFVADATDTAGMKLAEDIANSLKSP